MTQFERSKHIAMLATLDPVVAALRKRGIKAAHHCPGYLQVDGHDFVYAPSKDHWLLIHTSNHQGPWTRLMDDESGEAEQIADRIAAHISICATQAEVK